MSQRIHNLSKWVRLGEGKGLSFAKAKRRTVVLDVNCPSQVAFYVLHDGVVEGMEDGEGPLFLGVAEGRDTFEFGVDGGFTLLAEGGEAYVYTADGQQIETRIVSPVVFTRIANRRQRNPQLELMQYRMRLNQDARMKALEAEAERRVAAMEARLEQYMPERIGGTALGGTTVAPGRSAADAAAGVDADPEPEVAVADADVGGDAVRPSGKGRVKRGD